MKRQILTLVSTVLLAGSLTACGRDVSFLETMPVEETIINSEPVVVNKILTGTVTDSSYTHDNMHYGFNFLDVNFVTPDNIKENINIAYYATTHQYIMIRQTHNVQGNDPVNDNISITDKARVNQLIEELKSLKTKNSSQKNVIGRMLSILNEGLNSTKN
jgi:hypothetical protein